MVLGDGLEVHDPLGRDLLEHGHRVEVGVDGLELDLVVDGRGGDAEDLDGAAVGFGCDLLALAMVESALILEAFAGRLREVVIREGNSTYLLNPT